MKKSVIMIILAVYIVSVGIVGFFGIKARKHSDTVNVESVSIVSVSYDGQNIKIKEDAKTHAKKATAYYKKGGKFKINYEVKPANATNSTCKPVFEEQPGVKIEYATGETAFIVTIDLDEAGGVTSFSLDITIASEASNNAISDKITLGVYNPQKEEKKE